MLAPLRIAVIATEIVVRDGRHMSTSGEKSMFLSAASDERYF